MKQQTSVAAASLFLLAAACGSSRNYAAARTSAMPVRAAPVAEAAGAGDDAPANGFSNVNTDAALTTRTYLRAWSDDLLETTSKFRERVYEVSGYVVSEQIDYEDPLRAYRSALPERASRNQRRMAILSVTVPIETLPGLLDWIRLNTTIVEQYVYARRDATGKPSAAIAIAAGDGEEPLAVKMTKLDVYIEADETQVRFKAARMVPMIRATALVTHLLEEDGARQVMAGAAVGVALPSLNPGGLVPSPLVEVAGYPSTAEHDSAVVATIGVARYSRAGRDGASSTLNPFAGVRAGIAHAGEYALVVAGELGIEIIKASGVTLSASVRPQGFIASDSHASLEAGATLGIAF